MRFLAIFILTLLVGCVQLGPVENDQYTTRLLEAVPNTEGRAKFSGKVIYYANAKGYQGMINGHATGTAVMLPSSIVITDMAIFVLQWEVASKRFSIIKKIPKEKIADAWMEYGAVGVEALTVNYGDYIYDSFSFVAYSPLRGKGEDIVRHLRSVSK